jgi:palmitoyltransferase
LIVNPGFVPKGKRPKLEKTEQQQQRQQQQPQQQQEEEERVSPSSVDANREGPQSSRSGSTRRARERNSSPHPKFLDRDAVRDGLLECPPGLEQFYSKEAFICGMDGVPRFCNVCWNWKPDRTHHSGELGRCVRRYDHYCPWYVHNFIRLKIHALIVKNRVGGAVSETNNKFFIQFVFYSFLYAILIFIVSVWTILTAKNDVRVSPDTAFVHSAVSHVNYSAKRSPYVMIRQMATG